MKTNMPSVPVLQRIAGSFRQSPKRFLLLAGGVVAALVLFGLFTYEFYRLDSHRQTMRAYTNHPHFGGFVDGMDAYVHDGDGVLARVYMCQATSRDLWHTPNLKRDSKYSAGIEYLNNMYRADMIVAREYARKLPVPPKYDGGPLAGLLPQSRSAARADKAIRDFVATTPAYIYGSSKHLNDYCITRLYNPAGPLAYIEWHGDPLVIRQARSEDTAFRINQIESILKYETYPKISDVPSAMTGVESAYVTWLTELQTALKTLQIMQTLPASETDWKFLADRFAELGEDFDTDVLTPASRQSGAITPTVNDLDKLIKTIRTAQ